MKPTKKKKLESAGFRVGGVQDFLKLSDEEMALVDMKVQLVRMLRPQTPGHFPNDLRK